jgi:hypothetical protein
MSLPPAYQVRLAAYDLTDNRDDLRREAWALLGPNIERIATEYLDAAAAYAPATAADDPILRASRLSYVPGRSADFILVPKPYWMIRGSTGTSHGTPYEYDRRVPVVFYGAGIAPGRYLVPASPADIAPTFAALTRITLARTDGRVLTQALRNH